MVVLDTQSAQMFTGTIRQFQQDIHREWHEDAYDCWRVNRGETWADSTSVEAQELIESGTGKLYANGEGGVSPGLVAEGVLALDSPYRFRTVADSSIGTGHLLVLSGVQPDKPTRLFRVDDVKRTGSVLMDVYLTELVSTPLPEMP